MDLESVYPAFYYFPYFPNNLHCSTIFQRLLIKLFHQLFFIFKDMKPIEKLNELSPAATHQYESTSTVEINSDLLKVQLRVDEREVRQRELESKQAL